VEVGACAKWMDPEPVDYRSTSKQRNKLTGQWTAATALVKHLSDSVNKTGAILFLIWFQCRILVWRIVYL